MNYQVDQTPMLFFLFIAICAFVALKFTFDTRDNRIVRTIRDGGELSADEKFTVRAFPELSRRAESEKEKMTQ
jgi:hypothetical protein